MVQSAGIYCRISVDGAGDALGVKRQEADCRALAERKGWEVAEVYVDNDVGAWSGKPRPAYRRMLADVKASAIDAVIVYHLDRLTRRPLELEEFFEACDTAGVKDLACVTGDYDLASHDGQFLARILGAVARKESDDKSRRTKRKHLELAQAGSPVGGGRPFGYEDDRVTVRPAEAALVREAGDRILAGDTLRSICTDWSARGVKPVKAAAWTPTSLRRVLTEPRWAGHRSLGRDGDILARDAWPAILDETTHRRLRTILLDSSRASNVNFRARSYLLTGFLHCGKCGTRMVARAMQPKSSNADAHRRSYVCSSGPNHHGCGGIRIVADPLEDLIVEAILLRLDGPGLAQAIRTQQTPPASSATNEGEEIAVVEQRLDELAEMWATGEISRPEWLTARRSLESRLETARRAEARDARSSSLAPYVATEGALRAAWPDLGLDRCRAVLGAVIDRVTIAPAAVRGRGFDPERVDVTWRV